MYAVFNFTQLRCVSLGNWCRGAFFFLCRMGVKVFFFPHICLICMHILKCTKKSLSGIDLHSFPAPQAEWAVLKACRSTVLLLCGEE